MKLKILTWNISFAYGPGSEGISRPGLPHYEQRSKIYFTSALKSMSDFIRDMKIDIAFLQEVDFDSRRSCHIQQLDYLSRTSGLGHRLAVVSWDRFYVPYPGSSPRNHFGRVKSGGGILSRYPLEPIALDLLPKPRTNPGIYNYFYLHRYLQMFRVRLPQDSLNCMNLHLEAFSKDNRELHLVRAQDRLVDYNIDIAAGDFNGDVSLSEDRSKSWELHMSPEPSFPLEKSTLDGFILKKNRFKIEKIETPDTGVVSDHLPVILTVDQVPFVCS